MKCSKCNAFMQATGIYPDYVYECLGCGFKVFPSTLCKPPSHFRAMRKIRVGAAR